MLCRGSRVTKDLHHLFERDFRFHFPQQSDDSRDMRCGLRRPLQIFVGFSLNRRIGVVYFRPWSGDVNARPVVGKVGAFCLPETSFDRREMSTTDRFFDTGSAKSFLLCSDLRNHTQLIRIGA
jgi:hypothetical protein